MKFILGVYKDKWCAPFVVLDTEGTQSVGLDFFLPLNDQDSQRTEMCVFINGERHLYYLTRGKITHVGPLIPKLSDGRIAIEIPTPQPFNGKDKRPLGAVLTRALVDGQEIDILPTEAIRPDELLRE